MKMNKNKTKIALFIILFIYVMYVYYYYKDLKLESFIKHTVGSINLLGEYIHYIFDNIIINESLSKTIVISSVFVFLLKDVNLSRFIDSINGLEAYGVKISKEDATKQQLEADEKIRLMEQSENSDKEDINSIKIRKQIIELLIDNEKVVGLIERYLHTSRTIKIPLNLIPRKYKLEELGKIFEYKHSANCIKLISIKKDIEPILIDVYNELKEKNIIYCEI